MSECGAGGHDGLRGGQEANHELDVCAPGRRLQNICMHLRAKTKPQRVFPSFFILRGLLSVFPGGLFKGFFVL